ncbi:MAG: Hpt domain-containing protein [Kangiellaceae bacterium]|nr:Hpt domain-containing protein [Kangiellaceae bacterium]
MSGSYQEFLELDQEIQQEFFEDVVAAVTDVNQCVSELESGVCGSVIDRLFRAIHTVKGNCNMVFLTEFVNSTHKLEDLFALIRSEDIEYHSVYGRFAVQVVNLVKQQLTQLIENAELDNEVLQKLRSLIEQIENSTDKDRISLTEKAIIAIDDGHFSISMVMQDPEDGHAFSFMDATDIEFFEYMSARYQLSPVQHQFFHIFSDLALKLNAKLGRSVEEQQIRAALVFIHLSQKMNDQGKGESLNLPQVIVASGILSRMAGWTEAADLCLQSLEFHDGSGAPRALSGDDIHPAAQVISLSYEFAFIVMQHFELGYKQSLFTAVKQINSLKDTRFKGRLIQRFNALVKSEYLGNKKF